MRRISAPQVAVFFGLFTVAVFLGVGTTGVLVAPLPLGDFRGVALVSCGLVLVYFWAFAVYRVFLAIFPLGSGEVHPRTRQELAAQVNILFYLILFNSLIRTHFIPVPLMRLVYQALGARLGPNTYSAGVLLDPPLTIVGANSIIGHDAVVFAHAIEGSRFSLEPVVIGDNATIGATAVIMAGVHVGNGAIVSAGAVVPKNTRIGAGEVWGGVPARRLKPAQG